MYDALLQKMRNAFNSGKTRSFSWRQKQLKGLLSLLEDNHDAINEALHQDLNKHFQESDVMETQMCIGEVIDTINSLGDWMKPEKVKKNILFMMDSAYIQNEPFGVTLVIGAWNYPIQLVILPLLGAIAAGNCCVVKPSELSEATAALLEKLIPKYLDNDCYQVVNGGIPETTALLEQRWDFIFYTGNSTVGKIIMTAACKHLTPVLLELGGKSPVYIDKDVDLQVVARRLCWGKFVNCGQTCVAPDYIMCPAELQEELISNCKTVLNEFYSNDAKESENYGRIVNKRHWQRIQKLKGTCEVAVGGGDIEEDRYIAPTILKNVQLSDAIMQEEIFGPLMPIMPVKDHNEAIQIINEKEKPLALYVFTNNKEVSQAFNSRTSSGAYLVNDTIMHGGLSTLPFGGVGNSGMGRGYHGKFSFDAFSHKKAVLEKSLALDQVNVLRYPPYSEKKLGWLNWIMKKKVKKAGLMGMLPFIVMGGMVAAFSQTMGMMA